VAGLWGYQPALRLHVREVGWSSVHAPG